MPMATPARSAQSKSRDAEKPADAQPAHPDFDEGMLGLWQKYGQAVVVAAAAVLLFYVGKIGWGFIDQQHEGSIEAQFARATTPQELRAFADSHPGHELAGVADVELGDQAYAAGRMGEAIADYTDAQRILAGKPLAGRAEMGAAMAEVQSGQAAQGRATLESILNDTKELPVVRTEAGSQLASLAAAAGNYSEVRRIAQELMQIDADSPWTQRAFALTAQAPAAAATGAPTISLQPQAK